ncbi:hypothetical protein SNK03_007657 [Fusarium graminearum]
MSTDFVVGRISGICTCCNLDLAPLSVGRNKLALLCSLLKLGVYSLVLNTTLALNEG